MKRLLGVFLIFIFIIAKIFSQTTITGLVIDYDSKVALPGANVFLQSDWSTGSTTDINGEFVIKLRQLKSSDTLIVSYIGYKDAYIPLSSNSVNKKLNIELDAFAQLLGESVITARRIIAEEFTVKQMKQLDIYLNPAAKADPLLAINAMPASTTTDESASISLRGSRPDETGIYLNDVPIYDAIKFSQLNGIGTFSIFNTDIIERMHVFAGNPPLEYGNSTSGLVSLQTHDRIPDKPMNSLAISLANLGGLTSRKINDQTTVVAFGNYQPSQLFTGLNQDAMRDLESFSSYDLGVHLVHNFNPKLRFKLFNYSNAEGYGFNTRVPSYTGIFDMYKKRNFTIANFISQHDNREITVNSGYNISREGYQYSITDIDIDKQDFYFSSTYQHFFNRWSIKIGGSFDYRLYNSKGTKPVFNYAQDTNHPSVSFASLQEYNLPELFVYTKFDITDHLILGTGIRKNIVVDYTPDYWSYQGNLNYKINKKHNFNLSAGHYNRLSMPNAQQYEITHFESNQYTLDYTFTSDFTEIQTSVFSKNVSHSVYEDKILGGEFYTRINTRPFEFQFSVTSLNVEINNGIEKYPSEYDLDYFLRSVLKYNVKDAFEISTIYIFRQGSYYLPVTTSYFDNQTSTFFPVYTDWDHSKRLPDYHKIDLTVSKYWVANTNLAVVIYGSVSNLLNTNNVQSKNYNTDYSKSFNELYSQRSFYFGVSLMF